MPLSPRGVVILRKLEKLKSGTSTGADRVAFFLVSRPLVNFAIGLFCPMDFRPQSKPPGG